MRASSSTPAAAPSPTTSPKSKSTRRRREIAGVASSGHFCGQRPRYRVYFAAVFDRPFAAYGTWDGGSLDAGGIAASSDSQRLAANPPTTAEAGAYATFDTRRDRIVARPGRHLLRQRRRAPAPTSPPRTRGARFGSVAAAPEPSWNRALGRIRVSGGPRRDARHLLHRALPRPAGAADLQRRRRRATSAWTARCTAPAAAPSTPTSPAGTSTARRSSCSRCCSRAGPSDMVRSLLADAAQSGCLPRWPYANGQSMTMVGDPADPIIASAAAFGARASTAGAALAAMVKGATEPCRSANGDYLERQGLAAYLALGYVPFDLDTSSRNANSIFGSPDAVWGSAATTLEYAIDDFAIAQFAARALRRPARPTAPSCGAQATGARLFNPAQRPDRAALRQTAPSRALRQPRAAAASSRATRPSTPGWSRRTRPASSRRWAGRAQAPRAPRPLPARAQRRRRRDPHRPRAARQRAHPQHALALRLGAAGPIRTQAAVRRGPAPLQHRARRLPRQRRPRHALVLVRVRRARPLPGDARASACWRSAARCSAAPRSRMPHGRRLLIVAAGRGL